MASDHSSASRLANDSEEGFSSSLFQASNTRRSVSHHHTSQFSHSLSVHPSSDSSNRDSSKEELFSKQSTNSAHGLRMAVQDVFTQVGKLSLVSNRTTARVLPHE